MDCPSCDDDFDTERGMKVHHKLVHGESLAVEESECEECGETFEYYPCESRGKFCPECSYGGERVKFGGGRYGQRKKTTEFLKNLKERLSCSNCGFEDHRALDFHHCDEDEKSFGLHKASAKSYSIREVKEELRKCEVLCANCHRILHVGA